MRKIQVTLARTLAAALVLGLGASAGVMAQHPQAQPLPPNNTNVRIPADPNLPATGFDITTPENPIFAPSNVFTEVPGSNFLPTVYENYRLPDGTELPNTLPSTPDGAYN